MSWTAARLESDRQLGLALACAAILAAPSAWGASLNYCQQGGSEPTAVEQDRLIQVAGIVKAELDRSGHSVALVARSGLALQRLDQRYSHAGVSLKASPNTPWSVRQLYYACDQHRPRIFDQGMSGFVLGANDLAQGFVSIVLLPVQAAEALERVALDDQQALALLGDRYSANAHAFNLRYQNCNQWLAELLASAWGQLAPDPDARGAAQQWLRGAGYEPSILRVGWRPLVWLAAQLPWLHNDDHPSEDLAQAQFRVSMPQSIESFARAQWPTATHIELCYTDAHVVLRRGWEPLAADCQSGPGDEVTTLRAATAAQQTAQSVIGEGRH